ncbi:MAG TPA: matrixin family metalloprotease [Phycisphaerales bacterium]|nr:matrixin family metalloprotease [Phycisphaerales bacterium]
MNQRRMSGVVPSGCGVAAGVMLVASLVGARALPGAGPEDTQYARSFCFDPDSPPPEAERAALDLLMRGGGAEYNQAERWGGAMGSHRTLYWSLVPDGTMLPGREGQAEAPSNLFAQMDSKFGGNRALWIAQIQAAVDRWSYLTGITYVRITSGGNDWDDGSNFPESNFNGTTRGDVRIGGRNLDGGSGVLAFNYYPPGGDMVIDTAENWGSSANSYRFLRNVVMHELGHGLGMQHVCPATSTKLMEPFYSSAYDGPQHDDIRGVQSFYGDIYEPNETSGQATALGTLTVGGTLNPSTITQGAAVSNGRLTGLDNDGDIDYYRVAITTPMVANVVLTPVGTSYDSSTQSPGAGACLSGNVIDSRAIADLVVEVRTGNGAIILFTQGAGEPGATEAVSSVLLSPPGSAYFKVYETNVPDQSQAYDLAITGVSIPTMSATDATLPGLVRVTWSALPGAGSFAVYRNTSSTRTGAVQVGIAAAAGTQFDDATAEAGVPYWYWVDAQQGAAGYRAFAGPDAGSALPSLCDDVDFNDDGLFPDTTDIDDFLSVFSGGPCSLDPTCGDVDFNNDGLFPDTADIDSYLSVFSGGPCL